MKRYAALAVLLGVALVSSTAYARNVYLNGVNIDGLVNQEFKNCSVKVDVDGNIWITGKDYVVSPSDGKEPVKAPPAGGGPSPSTGVITKRYWLVTELSGGRAGYDIDVYINNQWVKKVQNSDEQIVMDITKHLVPGRNVFKFAALKAKGAAADPASKGFTNIIIGEGSSGGNNVVIDKPVLEYKRLAAEGTPFVNEHTVNAR